MSSPVFDSLSRVCGVSSSRPCLRGTGIMVEFLADRFAGGETIAEIAADYGVEPKAVEDGIRLIVFCKGTNVVYERRAARKLDHVLRLAHNNQCGCYTRNREGQ